MKWIHILLIAACSALFMSSFDVLGGTKRKKSSKNKKSTGTSKTKQDNGGRKDSFTFSGKTYKLTDYAKTMMKEIKPGTFMMGSKEDEEGHQVSEKLHKVKLTKPYYIGIYEVTQDFYLAVMGTRKLEACRNRWKDPSRPMDSISWTDAMEFCNALNAKKLALPGYKFTLPTEAQWEFAARGGKANTIYAGSNDLDEVGWHAGSRDKNFKKSTMLAGKKKANSLGLYDMSGNIREWCLDWYDEYPEKALAVNPSGPTDDEAEEQGCTHKVVRGGGIRSNASLCRCAARGSMGKGNSMEVGFRLAMIPDGKTPPAAKPAAKKTKK